jgi:hypothetical protein
MTALTEAMERLDFCITQKFEVNRDPRVSYTVVDVSDLETLLSALRAVSPKPIEEAPKGEKLYVWFASASIDGEMHLAGTFSFDGEGALWDLDQEEIIGNVTDTDIGKPLFFILADALPKPEGGE